MSYRLWWRFNDGMSGHVWLSREDLGRLTHEMLAQGMPWPGERLAASAQGREVVVTPQELEVALESSSEEPIALADASLWRDWLAFLRGAVHNGGILIRA